MSARPSRTASCLELEIPDVMNKSTASFPVKVFLYVLRRYVWTTNLILFRKKSPASSKSFLHDEVGLVNVADDDNGDIKRSSCWTEKKKKVLESSKGSFRRAQFWINPPTLWSAKPMVTASVREVQLFTFHDQHQGSAVPSPDISVVWYKKQTIPRI